MPTKTRPLRRANPAQTPPYSCSGSKRGFHAEAACGRSCGLPSVRNNEKKSPGRSDPTGKEIREKALTDWMPLDAESCARRDGTFVPPRVFQVVAERVFDLEIPSAKVKAPWSEQRRASPKKWSFPSPRKSQVAKIFPGGGLPRLPHTRPRSQPARAGAAAGQGQQALPVDTGK